MLKPTISSKIPLHESDRHIILQSEKGVLRKRLRNFKDVENAEVEALQNEYRITRLLHDTRGVRKALRSLRGGRVLELEYVDGKSIQDALHRGPFNIEDFLQIAISISDSLRRVHRKGIAHLSLDTSHILLKTNGQTTIIGWEKGRKVPCENPPLPQQLTHCSPEQTGKIRRPATTRSDLYALGIVFYEMLFGSPPFQGEAMDLIHAQLNKNISWQTTGIQSTILRIIERLLEKEPRKRYPTAHSLFLDLSRCLSEWKTIGRISRFNLGKYDLEGIWSPFSILKATPALTKALKKKAGGSRKYRFEKLEAMRRVGTLEFSVDKRRWYWSKKTVELLSTSDSFAQDLIGSLPKRGSSLANILEKAAIIGRRFNLDSLQALLPENEENLDSALESLLKSQLIFQLNATCYKFCHPLIRHSILETIPKTKQRNDHLLLARHLKTKSNQKPRLVLRHYLLANPKEETDRKSLAGLALGAGKEAQSKKKYLQATWLFKKGIKHLGRNPWRFNKLAYALHLAWANMCFWLQENQQLIPLCHRIINNCKRIHQTLPAYRLLIEAKTREEEYLAALRTGQSVLKKLGYQIPKKLHRPPLKPTLSSKLCKDPKTEQVLMILSIMLLPAFLHQGRVLHRIIHWMIHLSIEKGHTPASATAYVIYGILLCKNQRQIERGVLYGQMAQEMVKNEANEFYRSQVFFLYHAYVSPWHQFQGLNLPALKKDIRTNFRKGDYRFAATAALSHAQTMFRIGRPLSEINKALKDHSHYISTYRETLLDNVGQIQIQLNRRLQEPFPHETILAPSQKYLIEGKNIIRSKASKALFHHASAYLAYHFGESEKCLEHCRAFKHPLSHSFKGTVTFLHGLSLVAELRKVDTQDRKSLHRELSRVMTTLKTYSMYSPLNFRHEYLFVKAEKASLEGNHLKALELYERGIHWANSNGHLHEEALGHLLVGTQFLNQKQHHIAQSYIQEAHKLFGKWDARAIQRSIEQRFGQCFLDMNELSPLLPQQAEHLLKVSIALTSVAEPEKTAHKILNILINSSGAESGYIINTKGQTFSVIAEQCPKSKIFFLPSLLLSTCFSTKKTITSNSPEYFPIAETDDYLKSQRPKSVLCLPIIFPAKLDTTLLLYLESTQVHGLFTGSILKMIDLLAKHARVALENALLYQQLNRKIQERTARLRLQNQTLQQQKLTLESTLIKLKDTQSQLIHAEKMASLGQLTAGIAHELNNPVNFIGSGIDALNELLDDITQLLKLYESITPKNLDKKLSEIADFKKEIDYSELHHGVIMLEENIQTGLRRSREIIDGLLSFSRMEHGGFQKAQLTDIIENSLIILHNQYKNRIKISRHYKANPELECQEGRLGQVFMNLLSNAIQAIPNKGKIDIRTSLGTFHNEACAVISISDSGTGIPDELQQKIFDPFFTTKPVGKGTGLGMSISLGIIKSHRGEIRLKSQLGKGSTFVLKLPLHQPMISQQAA